jgi:hypothetical protein
MTSWWEDTIHLANQVYDTARQFFANTWQQLWDRGRER